MSEEWEWKRERERERERERDRGGIGVGVWERDWEYGMRWDVAGCDAEGTPDASLALDPSHSTL